MTDEKINRINELAKKAKLTDLTQEEQQEQAQLRQEYIRSVKKNLRNSLKGFYLKK